MAEHNHEHEHHHHVEMPEKSRIEEALSKYNLEISDEEVKEAVKKIIAEKVHENDNLEVKRFLFGSIELTTLTSKDSSAGLTLQEFAEFVAEQCPDAIVAYNLDGGGSTNLVVNGKRVCKTPGNREITDILYFASAEE